MQMLGKFVAKTKLTFSAPFHVQKTFPRLCFMLASNRAYLLLFLGRQPCIYYNKKLYSLK